MNAESFVSLYNHITPVSTAYQMVIPKYTSYSHTRVLNDLKPADEINSKLSTISYLYQ